MDRFVFATVSIVGEWSELSTFAKSIVARRATSFGVFFFCKEKGCTIVYAQGDVTHGDVIAEARLSFVFRVVDRNRVVNPNLQHKNS